MQPISLPKIDGVSGQPAAEMNSVFNELQNAIQDAGLTLDGTDLHQLSKAIATNSAVSDYYVDTGSVNAYQVNPVSPFKGPPSYYDGMKVRFIPLNSNTGASTINVNSLGSKNIRLDISGSVLPAEYINQNVICELFYNSAGGYFVLENKYPSILDFQNSTPIYCVDAGTTNALSAGISPFITGYGFGGLRIFCKVANTNTGASTINLNSLGVKNIKDQSGQDLVPGDLIAGMIAILIYDGTNFQLVNRGTGLNTALVASVYLSTNYTPSVSVSKIPFDTVEFDTGSFWDNTNKRFVLNKAGKYRVGFNVTAQINNLSIYYEIYKNGYIYRTCQESVYGSLQDTADNGSIIAITNVTTDYYELYINTTVPANTTIKSGVIESSFQIEYIGA